MQFSICGSLILVAFYSICKFSTTGLLRLTVFMESEISIYYFLATPKFICKGNKINQIVATKQTYVSKSFVIQLIPPDVFNRDIYV